MAFLDNTGVSKLVSLFKEKLGDYVKKDIAITGIRAVESSNDIHLYKTVNENESLIVSLDKPLYNKLRLKHSSMPLSDNAGINRLLFTSSDGTKWVPATTSTARDTSSMRNVNQTKIDPFGAIAKYATAFEHNVGNTPSPEDLYIQDSCALGYSFNRTGQAISLTFNAPIYIKAAPQSDGSAIIDAEEPYVQALPTTADGKIYIFLGTTTSGTGTMAGGLFELKVEHPVYCFRNGGIQLWTGVQTELEAVAAAGSLPSVTSSDNGKVLTVVNGVWAAGSIPSATGVSF